jgi:hypothetical protein
MAPGRGDVVGIAGIIAAQRPVGLGAQPLGIVDDMASGARSAWIEPLAEGDRRPARLLPASAPRPGASRSARGAAKAGESGPCRRSGHAGERKRPLRPPRSSALCRRSCDARRAR